MRQRNSDPKAFIAQVVQEYLRPGAIVSGVAISHGISTNAIRNWIPLFRDQPAAVLLPAFVPRRSAFKAPWHPVAIARSHWPVCRKSRHTSLSCL